MLLHLLFFAIQILGTTLRRNRPFKVYAKYSMTTYIFNGSDFLLPSKWDQKNASLVIFRNSYPHQTYPSIPSEVLVKPGDFIVLVRPDAEQEAGKIRSFVSQQGNVHENFFIDELNRNNIKYQVLDILSPISPLWIIIRGCLILTLFYAIVTFYRILIGECTSTD